MADRRRHRVRPCGAGVDLHASAGRVAYLLLTLAVVGDLLAIVIIAMFNTSFLNLLPRAAALVPLGLFACLVQRRVRSWWWLPSRTRCGCGMARWCHLCGPVR
nr:Na+/H+ antiporter NhaA [Actinoplanes sichuanensis]